MSDPVDPILNTWILAWNHHALLTQPLELLNANIFYPYQQTLLYSETLLLPSLILLPVKVATGNSILSYNLFVLLGFAATGGSGYLLGRWLFRNRWSGLMLGGVLAFNSYTLSNISQAQLLHLEWLPLALLYLGKLLHRPRLRSGLLFAFFLAAQFYTVVYYGLFSSVVVGIVSGSGWLLKAYPSSQMRWRTLGLLLGGIEVALLLCLPLALSYYHLSQEFGFERTWNETWPFSASLEMWLTAPAQNLLYGGRIGDKLPKVGFYAVDALFPGLLLISMAVSGLLLWSWRASSSGQSSFNIDLDRTATRLPLLLLLGIGFLFLLSLGPHPQIKSLQPNFDQLLASADVTVVADDAPPEIVLLPVVGETAVLGCEGEQTQIRDGQSFEQAGVYLHMRTIGWYEKPFTLSARVLDHSNTEVTRSAVDVEFPAHRPRSNLLTTHTYTLPLTVAPHAALVSPTVEVIAYQWQQEAERIVRRYFVTADGSVMQTLRLPLTEYSSCR